MEQPMAPRSAMSQIDVHRRPFLGAVVLMAATMAGCNGSATPTDGSPASSARVTTAAPSSSTVSGNAPGLGNLDVEPAWTQPGGSGTLETLAWRPGQAQFASGSSDGQMRLWTSAGQVMQTVQFDGFLCGLAWSPDGARLAVASTHGSVGFWPDAGGWPAHLTAMPNRYAAVAWQPGGSLLALAPGEGTVQLWRAAGTPGPALSLSGQTTALAWSPDGALLAGGNRAGLVAAWSSEGQQRWTASAPERKDVNTLAWSPDSRSLAAGYEDGSIQLFDATGKSQGTVTVGQGVNAVAWSPNGALLAASSLRLSVALIAVAQLAPLTELSVGYDVNAVVWSPAGDLLVAGADDHALHAWSVSPRQGPGPRSLSATGYMAR
jgi:WD40 repeat protein